MHTKALITLTTLLLVSFGTDAAVVVASHPAHGPNSLLFDTDTGLGWLDVSLTTNMTYNEVRGQFGAGKMFDGFRHASRNDFETFMRHAGFETASPPFLPTVLTSILGVEATLSFVTELGPTTTTIKGDLAIHGMIDSNFDGNVASISRGYINNVPQDYFVASSRGWAVSPDLVRSDTLGNFLVTSVPEASPACLLVIFCSSAIFLRTRPNRCPAGAA